MSSGRGLSGVPDAAGVAGGQPRHAWRTPRRLRGQVTRRGQVALRMHGTRSQSGTYIYIQHHTVQLQYMPSSELGLPQPSPASEFTYLCLYSPAAKGVGDSQFQRLEKKLSTLPNVLCAPDSPHHFHADPDPFFSVKMLNFYWIERRLYIFFIFIIITFPVFFSCNFAAMPAPSGMLDSVLWIRITFD